MKIINNAFIIAFRLIAIGTILSVIFYGAWHQLIMTGICLLSIAVFRSDNKRIDREGNQLVEFTEE